MENKKLQHNEINVKKYNTFVVFKSTYFRKKLAKKHEMRLRNIYKEIVKLYTESQEILKNGKSK